MSERLETLEEEQTEAHVKAVLLPEQGTDLIDSGANVWDRKLAGSIWTLG